MCSWAGSALRADWNLGQRSAASNLCIASRSKLVLPHFVDALLGICVFFSDNSLVCAGAVWMRWVAVWCTDLWRRGGVGGPATGCPHRRARSSRGSISLCRNCRRSEMLDLRRFPVSDEFNSDRKTFCVIIDRREFFEISNNGFGICGHVTPEDMEMSEILLRIEWKHFRIPAGPASGRNCPLKCRNLGFCHHGTFFQSFWKFEKWEMPKKKLPM